MMLPTTLERLRVFQAVASAGTIAGAARELGYTPSAVSQHVSALERETGIALVERSNRGVSTTAAGSVLADRASDILDLVRTAIDAAGSASGPHVPTLTIAAFPTAITALLLPARTRLAIGLRMVDAESEEALRALAAREVDAAITDGEAGRDDRLHRVVVRTEAIRLVTRADRSVRSLGACADAPWVLGGVGSRLGDAARRLCHESGFAPDVIVETDDHYIAFEAIRMAGAVTMLPELALTELPDGVVVSRVRLPIQRRIELVTRPALRDDPAIAAVAELLTETQ